jgi:hypothetical protein
MVLTSFSGGLGNQLFQYCAALVISNNNPKLIISDLGFYQLQEINKATPRSFKLEALGLEIHNTINLSQSRILRKFWLIRYIFAGRIKIDWKYEEIHEKKIFQKDSRIINKNGLIFLNGYWQCRNYPVASIDYLKKTLFRHCINKGLNQDIFKKSHESIKVSIHIRRGDYSKEALICSDIYFSDAIELMKVKIGKFNINWYVFSDDVKYAESVISPLVNATYVNKDNTRSDIDDFTAMCSCHHHIISNSTFSWWAAFTSKNSFEDSVIIAPSKWWTNIPVNEILIYPDNWLIVKA